MITTSKLNSSIVFSLAKFWDRGPRVKGRGPRVEEHKHPFYYNEQLRKILKISSFILSYLLERKVLIEKKEAATESYS